MKLLGRFILGLFGLVIITMGALGLIFWHTQGIHLMAAQNNNSAPAVHQGDLVITSYGRQISAAPKAGYVVNFLSRPVAMISIVYLPALLVVTAELKRCLRVYSDRTYRYRVSRYL